MLYLDQLRDDTFNKTKTYGMSLDISVNQLHGDWVHRNTPRAVDESIGDDSLGVNTRQRLWSLVSQDGLLRHLD